jgi:hypothetical protein
MFRGEQIGEHGGGVIEELTAGDTAPRMAFVGAEGIPEVWRAAREPLPGWLQL